MEQHHNPSLGPSVLVDTLLVCSPPQPMWNITIHPLGPASSLTLFPSSNRCGTAPKSTLLWGQRLINGSLFSSPTSMWDHLQIHPSLGPASYKGWFVLLPNIDVGPPPNPPPFGASVLNGGLFFSPTNVRHHNPPTSQSTPFGPSVLLTLFTCSNRCETAPKSTPFEAQCP